jgi:predicted permease
METLWQDLKYGVRMLSKSPGLTAVAILTLALGIGANSTAFSWANATLLDPIPGMANPGQVVSVSGGVPGHLSTLSYPDFGDLRRGNRVFSGLAGFAFWPMSITDGDQPERIFGTLVSANYFEVLGVAPVWGRGFLEAEGSKPDSAPVAVISYRLWKNRYKGQADVLGKTISLNQHLFTIVGVAPREFQGSYTALRCDIWVPIVMDGQLVPGGSRLNIRDNTWVSALGRLQPGITREKAETALETEFQQLAQEYPESHRVIKHVTLFPLWRAPGANNIFSVVMPMLMAVAALVLLLTCANVANLMLVRAVSRTRELAVRLSLGASRARLIRQLLIESSLLALAGGAAGLLLTLWDSRFFMEMAPHSELPIWVNVHLDHRIFLFTLFISIAAAVLFGILPAVRASAASPIAVLKDEASNVAGGRNKARLTSMLAIAQISLSLLLLISASLFVQSFQKAQQFYPGFNPNNVLLESYDLFPNGYDQWRGMALDQQILDNIRNVPGVEAAALADWVPLGFSSHSESFAPEGYAPKKDETLYARSTMVSPDYFHTMEIPLLHGRDFTSQDLQGRLPVVIINEELAERYWRGHNAIGERLMTAGEWKTVIGIAQNSIYGSLNDSPSPFLYLPLSQYYSPQVTIHVRTAGDPLAAARAIESAVHKANGELPLFDVGTLKERIQAASTIQRVAGPAVGVLGALALVLAAVGIYGVIAYTTRLRTQEIGIRVALGAQRSDVMRLILREGAIVTFAGLLLGSGAALLLMRLLSSLLFGVSAADPATFLGIPLLLAAVIFIACYLPARRAMRVDPVIALRYE